MGKLVGESAVEKLDDLGSAGSGGAFMPRIVGPDGHELTVSGQSWAGGVLPSSDDTPTGIMGWSYEPDLDGQEATATDLSADNSDAIEAVAVTQAIERPDAQTNVSEQESSPQVARPMLYDQGGDMQGTKRRVIAISRGTRAPHTDFEDVTFVQPEPGHPDPLMRARAQQASPFSPPTPAIQTPVISNLPPPVIGTGFTANQQAEVSLSDVTGATEEPKKPFLKRLADGVREERRLAVQEAEARHRTEQLAFEVYLGGLNNRSLETRESHIDVSARERQVASDMERGLLHLPNPRDLNALVRFGTANVLSATTGVGLHSDEAIVDTERWQTEVLYDRAVNSQRSGSPFELEVDPERRQRIHDTAAEQVRRMVAEAQAAAANTVYVTAGEVPGRNLDTDMPLSHRELAFSVMTNAYGIPIEQRDISERDRTLTLTTRLIPGPEGEGVVIDPDHNAIGAILFDPATKRANVDPLGRDQRWSVIVGKHGSDTYPGTLVAEMRIIGPEQEEVIRTDGMSDEEYDRRLDHPTFVVTAEVEPRLIRAEALNVVNETRQSRAGVMGMPVEIDPMNLMVGIATAVTQNVIPQYRKLASVYRQQQNNGLSLMARGLEEHGYGTQMMNAIGTGSSSVDDTVVDAEIVADGN